MWPYLGGWKLKWFVKLVREEFDFQSRIKWKFHTLVQNFTQIILDVTFCSPNHYVYDREMGKRGEDLQLTVFISKKQCTNIPQNCTGMFFNKY